MGKNVIHTPNGIVETEENAEQVTANEARAAARAQEKIDEEARVAQKATDKAAGNQKLVDLGLTQAEVDALTG